MYDQPLEVQREFLIEFLNRGLPRDAQTWRNETRNWNTQIAILVEEFGWAQELFIQRVEQVRNKSEEDTAQIEKLVSYLCGCGCVAAYDTVEKYFKDHPKYEYFVFQVINQSPYAKSSGPYDVIYRALSSTDVRVRRMAAKFAGSFLGANPSQFREEVWADALLRRYGRVPTEADLVSDPVADAIRMQDPGLSLSILPRVRATAAKRAAKSPER